MRAVVQRVTSSKVVVDGQITGAINKGINVLIGISCDDNEEDLKYIRDKIINFMAALGGEEAKKLYDQFVLMIKECGIKVETGIFGADMKVDIQNDGPVTILLDSKKNF